MNNDLVSVILPTYNRVAFLDRSISSIKSQNYRPIEVIIVDDFSTDDTQLFLLSYDFWDLTVKIMKNKKNIGIWNTRNVGILSASGEYLAFIDSDDEWINNDKIKLQVDFLKKNTWYWFVATAWSELCEGALTDVSYFSDDSGFRDIALSRYSAHTSTWLFKSSLISSVWYFWNKRAEDLEYLLRLGTKTKFHCLPEVCECYHKSYDWDHASHIYMNWLYAIYICFLYKNHYPKFYSALYSRICRVFLKLFN